MKYLCCLLLRWVVSVCSCCVLRLWAAAVCCRGLLLQWIVFSFLSQRTLPHGPK